MVPQGGRSTPVDVEIDYEKHARNVVPGYPPIYTFFVKGSSYLELPLDANVRLPTEKSTPYRDMTETLESEPNKFLFQNGGIDVISSEVKVTERRKKVKMTFPPGSGIVNGGHTQLALLDVKRRRDISDAVVRLEVIEQEFDPQELASIAASRNTASNVKPYSTAEKRGYFAKIKSRMIEDFEKHIIWYENRRVPNNRGLGAVDLIARLNLFNIKLYQSPWHNGTEQPNKSATSKSATFNFWLNNQSTYLHIYPLVNDIINLEEHVRSTFHNGAPRGFTILKVVKNKEANPDRTIFLGSDIKWELPTQFLLPILASFRAVVKYDEDCQKIGWYEKPEDVFDRSKKQILNEVSTTFKTHHNEINRMSKDSNLWRILYDTVSRRIDVHKEWRMNDIPE